MVQETAICLVSPQLIQGGYATDELLSRIKESLDQSKETNTGKIFMMRLKSFQKFILLGNRN